MKKQNQVVFYTIHSSALKRFFVIDCLTGTSVYYAVTYVSTSAIAGVIGSVAAVVAIKRIRLFFPTS
ncbi:hypothetical protein [Alkalihalobacillus sp. LMS39]|uniref:hypothetical protein n=1 Tax=Alkalihalobacillus sp. LMS39 TaxID=2924032 RepID=UPI001FB3CDBA|nr:hypothetical protein [Alkalihalobacillus sp. LMS39]UOE95290.1 hypothetical protein MM271_06625 [Alkalihalobacillus sp. LMS39]